MKIEKNLPQFPHHTALILVLGNHSAEVYLASRGIIKTLDPIYVSKNDFLNIDAFYMHPGGRKNIFGSGTVYRPKEDTIKTHFLNALQKKLDAILKENTIEMIYLLVPDYLKNETKNSLPSSIKGTGLYSIYGNFQGRHPFDILATIKKNILHQSPKHPARKPEARRILTKTEKARNVIGHRSESITRPS